MSQPPWQRREGRDEAEQIARSVVAELVTGRDWKRRRLTAGGQRCTGLGAGTVVEMASGLIMRWLDDLVLRCRHPPAPRADPNRPPRELGALMELAGLRAGDSDVHGLVLNPLLRHLPAVVAAELTERFSDVRLLSFELMALQDHRPPNAARNSQSYLWTRRGYGSRANAMLMLLLVEACGELCAWPIGFRGLDSPDARRDETEEAMLARAARELLDDLDVCADIAYGLGRPFATGALRTLPVIVTGVQSYGYPAKRSSHQRIPLSHQLTPAIAAELVASVDASRRDGAFQCATSRNPDGIEAAGGRLILQNRAGCAVDADVRRLTTVAAELNRLDPHTPAAADLREEFALTDMTEVAQAADSGVQWLMTSQPAYLVAPGRRLPVLVAIRRPGPMAAASVWAVAGERRSLTAVAVERRLSAAAGRAVDRDLTRYRRRVCVALQLNGAVAAERVLAAEGAAQTSGLLGGLPGIRPKAASTRDV